MGMILDSNLNPEQPPYSQLDGTTSISASSFDMILAEFTALWNRGELPRAEEYFDRLCKEDSKQIIELIFHEFRLAENDGLEPEVAEYLERFPDHAEELSRLFSLHEAFRSTSLGTGLLPFEETETLPEVGDAIGPYQLVQYLGRGGLAKVFLAEQTNLDNRLIVIKVSTKITHEPKLLARASHPNIVEVISTTMVNGNAFQMICMPFLGGATLAALLGERRKLGTRPATGDDLLEDIDRIQPKGYPASGKSRPARELVSALSYSRATAWMVARLAEALHHAYSRGVVHGDVKPSNILITADANPMLLDFNLAVGWTLDTPGKVGKNLAEDIGGTLAYMAPERLQTVALADRREPAKHPKAAARHRADIYSLGVVLLEALTGKTPDIPSAGKAISFQQLASAYVSSRRHDGQVMIRSAHGTSLPSDLKAILRHCLAPDPADRYQNASELSEDLDRWRTDRPLLFAKNSGKAATVQRWVRRHRAGVLTAAVALFAVVAATAVNRRIADDKTTQIAMRSIGQLMDSRSSGAFSLRRVGSGDIQGRRDPADIARQHLELYGLLGSDDWRSRDEFHKLPAFERNELEVWLLEQSLRYAHALGQHPDSPEDWHRAYVFLKRISDSSPFLPLSNETETLRVKSHATEQVGMPEREANDRLLGDSSWMNDYLEGVASELQGRKREALDHFLTVLKTRPTSFWTNYRAAAVAFTLITAQDTSAIAIASRCLKVCVDQRPENAILRHQYATCLSIENLDQEALKQYDKALQLNPSNPETLLSRSFLRLRLKQPQSFIEDIKAYEKLCDRNAPAGESESLNAFEGDENFNREVRRNRRFTDDDEAEAMARTALGEQLWRAEHHEMALEQLNRALAIKPESPRIRYVRAIQLLKLGNKDAESEFASLVNDPKFESFVRNYYHDAVFVYIHSAYYLVRQGNAFEAIRVARLGTEVADQVGIQRPSAHFILATALALASKNDKSLASKVVAELKTAYALDPLAVQAWISQEPLFEAPGFQLSEISQSNF